MDSIVVGRGIQRTKPKLNSEIGKTKTHSFTQSNQMIKNVTLVVVTIV